MMKNILLCVGITILFLGTCITPSVAIDNVKKASNPIYAGNTLYVGGTGEGNYTKIQDAIDNALNGDTVFVYDDSAPYKGNIVIAKPINLIGENRKTTIIDNRRIGNIITILKDGVTIKSFTLTKASRRGGSSGNGIKILSNDNKIINNIITSNFHGINCISSADNTIIGNIIKDNLYGILLEESNNNLISENKFISNIYEHLRETSSNLNNINNNIFEFGSKDGIYQSRAKNSNITDNSFEHCGISFQYSSFNNFSNNTVNGKPFVYMIGESNKTIKEAGQIYLKDCINITIQKLEISNVSKCIFGENNRKCLITDNIFNNNHEAISLGSFSSNNIIRNNIISNCYEAIRISEGKDCIISENNICHGAETYLPRCSNISIINNTFIDNSLIYLQSSNHCNISNNIISQGYQGIFFEKSEFNVISNNDISLMSNGIKLDYSSKHNNILNNNLSDNDAGLLLKDDSKYNTIINNFFTNNGVILSNTRNNAFLNNLVNDKPLIYLEEESEKTIDTNAGQIILVSCDNITIQKQEICNTTVGIELLDTVDCNISSNVINWNKIHGVLLEKSKRNAVTGNKVSNNEKGIFLDYNSDINTITDNSFSDNRYGITIINSKDNTISKNNFQNNKRHSNFEYCKNIWKQNYWGRARIFPKLIFGKIKIVDIKIPWFNVDWHPAQEPYVFSEAESASVVVREENSKIKITLAAGGQNYPSYGYSFANSVTIRLNETVMAENNLEGNTGWEVGESLYIGGSTPILDDDESAVGPLSSGDYTITVTIIETVIFDDTITIV